MKKKSFSAFCQKHKGQQLDPIPSTDGSAPAVVYVCALCAAEVEREKRRQAYAIREAIRHR